MIEYHILIPDALLIQYLIFAVLTEGVSLLVLGMVYLEQKRLYRENLKKIKGIGITG